MLCFGIKSWPSVNDRCVGNVLGPILLRNRDVAGGTLTGERGSDTRWAGLLGESLLIRPRGVTHVEFSETARSLSERKPRWTCGSTTMCADPLKSIYLARRKARRPHADQVLEFRSRQFKVERRRISLPGPRDTKTHPGTNYPTARCAQPCLCGMMVTSPRKPYPVNFTLKPCGPVPLGWCCRSSIA